MTELCYKSAGGIWGIACDNLALKQSGTPFSFFLPSRLSSFNLRWGSSLSGNPGSHYLKIFFSPAFVNDNHVGGSKRGVELKGKLAVTYWGAKEI